MATEWNAVTVGDVFDLVNGFAFKSADFIDSGVPVIKIKNVKAGEFSEHEFSYVSEDFLGIRANKLVKFGDLLISMSGNRHDGSPETWVGKVAQFRKTGNYFINQRVGALRAKAGVRIHSRFASYVLSSFPYQELFIAIATSSGGQANLSPAQILSAPMRNPSLHEQRAIAHILGTLDDKIELNRKQNETLEAMARALFKAWFVDFEPVRAKMEGRWQRGQSLPGLPAHIYNLFPDRLVESELGEIPEGWGIGSFADAVEIIGGGTPKTSVSEYWNGEIPWFSVVDTPASSDVFVVQTEKSITQAGLNGSSARLIAKGTTIISARGTVGNLAIAGRDMTFNQSCYALRGKNGAGSHFVFLSAQRMVEQLKAMAHGSVFSTITRQTFEAVAAVLPPENLLQQFERSVACLFDAILSSVNESRSLAQLRDTLLPKLISGELRVPEAERLVGLAAA